jgi:hypothetical protein
MGRKDRNIENGILKGSFSLCSAYCGSEDDAYG